MNRDFTFSLNGLETVKTTQRICVKWSGSPGTLTSEAHQMMGLSLFYEKRCKYVLSEEQFSLFLTFLQRSQGTGMCAVCVCTKMCVCWLEHRMSYTSIM